MSIKHAYIATLNRTGTYTRTVALPLEHHSSLVATMGCYYLDSKFDGPIGWTWEFHALFMIAGALCGCLVVTPLSFVGCIRPIVPYYAVLLALACTGWTWTWNTCALEDEFLRMLGLGLSIVCCIEFFRIMDPNNTLARRLYDRVFGTPAVVAPKQHGE